MCSNYVANGRETAILGLVWIWATLSRLFYMCQHIVTYQIPGHLLTKDAAVLTEISDS